MKLKATISLMALIFLGSIGTALAQHDKHKMGSAEPAKPAVAEPQKTVAQAPKNCEFNIVGTWKAQLSPTEARLYTFDANGVVKVLKVSGAEKPREIASAKYELNNAEAPDQISFRATGKNRIFGRIRTAMKVVSYDDSSITCQIPGAGTVRWSLVDPDRYFVVLVARQGEFYDSSGSAFPVLVKSSAGVSTIDAVGIYSDHGKAVFGTIPTAAYKDYLREARGDSEVILRLEINSRQYERALKIVQVWQRRAREGSLPYDKDSALSAPLPMNNILLVKAVTETLNLCKDDLNLYKLDYVYPSDWITNEYSPEFVPFFYFKELRKRNEARHIEDKKFQQLVPLDNLASR